MRYLLMTIIVLATITATGCAAGGVKISGSVTYARGDSSVAIHFAQ
jgi:hypothetical protein